MKSISNKKIDGVFFNPESSKAETASILIDNKAVSVFKGDECLYHLLKVQSVQDNKSIFLENGSLFVTKEELNAIDLKSLIPKTELILKNLDKFRLKSVIIILLTIIVLVIGYRFIFISFSSTLVYLFPHNWEKKIGESTYKTLSSTILEKSEIPEKRRTDIREKSQKIFKHSELYKNPEIKFKKSTILGPNALALPGGPIIITDDLIKLLKDDELILSVIAHEIAHIKERHSLQQIVEVAGLSSIAWMIFGLDESILEEIAFIGINVWSLKKSRDLEKDADLIALKLLEKIGMSKNSLIQAIEKLTKHYCLKTKLEKIICMNEIKSSWFSTHPTGAERLKYLKENIN